MTLAFRHTGSGRRLVDVVVTGCALLVLSPLLLIAALLVKLTSNGPVLFHQERIGRHGKRFRMLKFRTMHVGADAEKAKLAGLHRAEVDAVRFKMKNDPRVTSVGKVLRRWSVDELPQLLNVVCGDMTLIGPRPAVMREVNLYDGRALRRLEVPQGLTCLWQVGGRSDLSFDEQVALDIEYIDRTSKLDEIKIVLRTIPAVITGRGAY